MDITIGTANIDLTTPISEFAKMKLQKSAGSLKNRIQSIRVRLGIERRHSNRQQANCMLVATMNDGEQVVITEQQNDLYHAIAEAAQRMRRSIGKQKQKKSQHAA